MQLCLFFISFQIANCINIMHYEVKDQKLINYNCYYDSIYCMSKRLYYIYTLFYLHKSSTKLMQSSYNTFIKIIANKKARHKNSGNTYRKMTFLNNEVVDLSYFIVGWEITIPSYIISCLLIMHTYKCIPSVNEHSKYDCTI